MEYEFSDDVKMLRQAIREFAEKEVAPIAREIDEQERVPFETLKKAGELGLMGLPFPEAYGGIDAGITGYCVLISDSKLTRCL
jgi:acyl-CoA dehydrogenase